MCTRDSISVQSPNDPLTNPPQHLRGLAAHSAARTTLTSLRQHRRCHRHSGPRNPAPRQWASRPSGRRAAPPESRPHRTAVAAHGGRPIPHNLVRKPRFPQELLALFVTANSDPNVASCTTEEACAGFDFSDSAVVSCTTALAFHEATFQGGATATCSADSACAGASFTGSSAASCSATYACTGASFAESSTASCSANKACAELDFSGGSAATCTSEYDCRDSTFTGSATANCSTAHACRRAQFSGSSTATCGVEDA